MRVVSRELLEQLLAVGNESQSFELKGPGDLSDKPFVARVARAAMSMGNHRDGGIVCVGIDEKQMQAMLPGLSPEQAAAWGDYDNVAAALARYADPAVVFTIDSYVLSSGASWSCWTSPSSTPFPTCASGPFPQRSRMG